MKATKKMLTFLVMFVVLVLCVSVPEEKASAATIGSLLNVMEAPKAPAGSWHKTVDGKRYMIDNTQMFATKHWYKIGSKYYYFTVAGYVKVGFFNYNKRNYYFDKYGRMVTGWKKIDGKKYYFWKSATKGELAGSAATGKVTIAGEEYYFNSKGQMQTGWKKVNGYYYYFAKNTGIMVKNKKIGKYTVDEYGRRVKGTKAPVAKTGSVDFWVGDSRTVGLGSAMGISGKCIASVGQGYYWYCSTAESQLKSRLNSKPTATVVFNLGVNDIDNHSLYISRYKTLLKQYPKARFFFLSVNPIDFKKYRSPWVTDASINTFNARLKAAFPNQYLDSYTMLKPYVTSGKSKYASKNTDSAGLHYSNEMYKKIYNFVLSNV